ncbi:MAG: NAD(P)-binding protein, partial [Planctomycetaceae bacterium]|nr:NAD(P)-binding protein [Planctomycetaceae bacterium]
MIQLRVSSIRLPVGQPEAELSRVVAARTGIAEADFRAFRILRKSLDARQRDRLQFVYSVVLSVDTWNPRRSRGSEGVTIEAWEAQPFEDATPGTSPMPQRPVVVGSGPAGLLAGYYLALKGYRPLILERGQCVRDRVPAIRQFDAGGAHDPENNYLFGE